MTNRVIDYNAKRGIAKDLDYDKARKLLSALANSGSSHGSPEDVVDRYSWEPMINHLVADADEDDVHEEDHEENTAMEKHYSPESQVL